MERKRIPCAVLRHCFDSGHNARSIGLRLTQPEWLSGQPSVDSFFRNCWERAADDSRRLQVLFQGSVCRGAGCGGSRYYQHGRYAPAVHAGASEQKPAAARAFQRCVLFPPRPACDVCCSVSLVLLSTHTHTHTHTHARAHAHTTVTASHRRPTASTSPTSRSSSCRRLTGRV
jgi:hypothetical protein